jgi:hypothetical protein
VNIIIRPRQAGKTYEAVQWVKADPERVLIVHTFDMAKHVMRQYRMTRRQVMSVQESETRLWGRRAELAVDNVELCYPGEIHGMIHMCPVTLVTLTGPDNRFAYDSETDTFTPRGR